MTYNEIKELFDNLPKNFKTKDIDRLDKKLIKEKQDVSCLKDYVKNNNLYNRTYFQVSLGILPNYVEQYEFIEQNALLLNYYRYEVHQAILKPSWFHYWYMFL